MTSLITVLISLLGYGSPADFENYSETQLQNQIELAQEQEQQEEQEQEEEGILDDWDY